MREHQLGLGPQRLDGRPEVAVAGGALDRQVELAVGVSGVDDVVGRRRRRVRPSNQRRISASCSAVRRWAASWAANASSTLRSSSSSTARSGIERGDVRTAARLHLDEPGVLERPDRLAHRVARHAELFGETILEQPLARLQLAGADHLADLVGDDLAQRAVSISESAR